MSLGRVVIIEQPAGRRLLRIKESSEARARASSAGQLDERLDDRFPDLVVMPDPGVRAVIELMNLAPAIKLAVYCALA